MNNDIREHVSEIEWEETFDRPVFSPHCSIEKWILKFDKFIRVAFQIKRRANISFTRSSS